ncbi:MAG: lysophospholipase [Promethearchaeota archaeon]
MMHEESSFEGVKGLKIFYQKWIPDSEPKAILQIVHGFGEHSGRYMNVINEIIPLGFAVYADDHRGHGRSEGKRNYVDRFDDYVEDERILNEIIQKDFPGKPIFMLGHSMGSAIAVYFAKKYGNLIKGVILTGTGTQIGGDISGFLKFMAKILSVLAPKMAVAQGDISEFLSHDPKVVEDYNNDPNVYAEKTTTRLGAELMKAFGKITEAVKEIKIPVLIQCGGDDKLVLGVKEVTDALQTDDKEIHIYDGLYHEIFNEPEDMRKKPLNDLKNWLKKHTK